VEKLEGVQDLEELELELALERVEKLEGVQDLQI